MYPANPENISTAMRVAKRYPDNIYIQNYDELSRITLPNGNAADMTAGRKRLYGLKGGDRGG